MPTTNLPSTLVEVVLEALNRHVPEREIRVMGSRAEGRGKPFSDLDLVVMGGEPLSLRALGQLRHAFDDSRLPFTVDIIEWASCSDAFRRVIAARAKLFKSATLAPQR